MTRQQKIEALEAIKNGTPIEYALMKKPCILNLHEDGFYFKNDGTIISKEDKEKYLNDAIIICNVSEGHKDIIGKDGKVIITSEF